MFWVMKSLKGKFPQKKYFRNSQLMKENLQETTHSLLNEFQYIWAMI